MTIPLRSRALALRPLALSAAVATLALALVGLPAVNPHSPLPAAAADSASCTAYGDFPNVLPGSTYPSPFVYRQDAAVNAYIAGDWNVVPGAAEAEGVLVVGDDVTFSTGEGFFVGKVGVGSQVSAPAGSDMLTVGGDVAVIGAGSILDVGPVLGGNLRAGGTITPTLPSPSYTFNGGAGFSGAVAPLAPYATIPVYYSALSAELEALSTTGSTVDLGNSSEVHFVGDGTQSRQVFTVSGADLGTTIAGKDVHFDNMATDAVVVINVTGPVAEMNTWRFYVDGVELEHDTPANRIFSNWAQSVVWNFSDATDVTLGVNAQIPGSILIPSAGSTLDLRSSVNGRLFVNGDVTFGGGGSSGIELHSYGMRTCSLAPVDGTFTIDKTISDPDGVADDARDYTGTYECLDALGNLVDDGTWTLEAGESVTIPGLPSGTVCSATEDASTLTAGPSADPAYTWGPPTYSAADVTVIADDDVSVTVTNVVLHEVGALSITKALTDVDGVVDGTREFEGTYSCSDSSPAVVASGAWQLEAGDTVTVDDIPSGAVCTIAEDAATLTASPSATDPSYSWGAATYSSTGVTISTGGTASITVTNMVERGLGDLEMLKILDDPYDVVDLSRVYTGTWSCTLNSAVIESGTWSTVAGAAALTLATDLPAGTVCTLAEDAATLSAPPLAGFPQYLWLAPVITPASVTIVEGGVQRITVTNIVYDPIGDISGLAHAGTDSVRWILVGSAVAAGGILLIYVARRRRIA